MSPRKIGGHGRFLGKYPAIDAEATDRSFPVRPPRHNVRTIPLGGVERLFSREAQPAQLVVDQRQRSHPAATFAEFRQRRVGISDRLAAEALALVLREVARLARWFDWQNRPCLSMAGDPPLNNPQSGEEPKLIRA